MAMPSLRQRRPVPDSDAHEIAAQIEPAPTVTRARLTRVRAPQGAMVGHYEIKSRRPGGPDPIAITASAQVLHGGSVARTVKRAPSQSWQNEAWDLRKEIGELRFAGDRVARAVSQCRIYVAEVPTSHDATPQPVPDDSVVGEYGREMFGSRPAVAQAMKLGAQHLTFNGESNLLIRQEPDAGPMSWAAHSVQEISGPAGSMKLDNGVETIDLGPNDIVVRCWTPDPEKSGLADSPTQSVLPVARELKGLTEHTAAQIDSRLAGAGLLVVPDSIEVLRGQVSAPEEGDDDADLDEFVRALVEAMTVPLRNRSSAASVVPLVVKVPEALVDKIQHISFASQFDAMAKDMREEAIRRVGLGMDSDPSILLGLGGGNHWSAWLVSEDEVQLVVSPLAATICHSLTMGWLRPVLEQLEGVDPSRYMVWFDASALELRPDKSADSRELHGKMLISDDAVRRENGFGDTDKPDKEEYARRLIEELLRLKPELAADLLPRLGVELELTSTEVAAADTVPAAPAATPAENDGQDRELPDTLGDPPPAASTAPGAPA